MSDLVTINVAALRELVSKLVDERLATRTTPAEYISTGEAARVAKVAPGTVRRWIREGKLKPHRAGRELRVVRTDLERLLAGHGQERELTPEELAARDFGG